MWSLVEKKHGFQVGRLGLPEAKSEINRYF